MAFLDNSLAHGWCSEADCSYRLGALDNYLGGNVEILQHAIRGATGRAQSYLRSRWPEAFPFSTPPQEIRDAVAAIAVQQAVLSFGADGAIADLSKGLLSDADRAVRYLQDVASGKAEITLVRPADGTRYNEASIAGPPTGEAGFTGAW